MTETEARRDHITFHTRHTADEWWSQCLNLDSLGPELCHLATAQCCHPWDSHLFLKKDGNPGLGTSHHLTHNERRGVWSREKLLKRLHAHESARRPSQNADSDSEDPGTGLRPAFLTVCRCCRCHWPVDQTLSGKDVEEGTPAKSQRLAAGPALANPGDETMARLYLTSPGLSVLTYNIEMTSGCTYRPGWSW